jgi:TRAP-type mannitol/chloroaromatic compound transport system permease small subunit
MCSLRENTDLLLAYGNGCRREGNKIMIMRRCIEHLGRLVDKLTNSIGFVVSFTILAVIGIVTYEVVVRYYFHNPTFWVHEATQYTFAVYIAFAGAYALQRRAHVRVDIFYRMFPPRIRQIVAILIFTIFMMFSGILLWQIWGMTQSSLRVMERSSSTWAPPIYPIKVLLFTAIILLLIQGTVTFIREIRKATNLDSN